MKFIIKLLNLLFTLDKKKIEAICFNQGDIIQYVDPAYQNEKLTGLILAKNKDTYTIKWFGFYSNIAKQTRAYIEERSTIILPAPS